MPQRASTASPSSGWEITPPAGGASIRSPSGFGANRSTHAARCQPAGESPEADAVDRHAFTGWTAPPRADSVEPAKEAVPQLLERAGRGNPEGTPTRAPAGTRALNR